VSKNHPHLTPFFNGFKVKSAEELIEAKTYKTAYNFGKTLAYLFFLAIPILLGFGVVMLLKRLIYGKKKVENPYTDFDYKPNNNKDKRI
jgi:O-antigen/teichoic acid export membrane protein